MQITSQGTPLESWVYLPKQSSSPPPVVVMAHGMGAQKDIGLWTYAEKFVEAGMAVVVFDYRSFGGSGGSPRHWVSPRRHLQDWEAVVSHIQSSSLDGRVDGSRIGLWGVSYSGGHVLVTAAKFRHNISVVIANEPYVSPAAVLSTTSVRGAGRTLRLLAVGISDELRRLISRYTRFKLPPVYLRLVAPITDPNALALLPLQESEMAIRNVHAPPKRQGGWQNKVLARVVLEALGYNPSKHFGKITAPVYFRVAMLDHLCPPSVVLDAVKKAGFMEGQIVIQERNVTHLEAHSTGVKESEIKPVIAFLRKHLRLSEGGVDEATQQGAAAAGGEQGLSTEGAEELAEVQFPSA
jgi:pimeloyl-ACP methyl ester carboxylesterase